MKEIVPFRKLLRRGDGRKFFWDQGRRYYLKEFDPFGFFMEATDDTLTNHHPFMIKEVIKIDEDDIDEWVVLRYFAKAQIAKTEEVVK